MKDVTVVVTACNRSDLLKITLESFIKYNTYPVAHVIVIEDSGLQNINDFVRDMFTCKVTLIYNPHRVGQMKSIERAASFIDTPFTFHCEEDWEFYDYGFIEKSLDILEKDRSVSCIFMRSFAEYYSSYGWRLDYTDMGDYYYVEQNNTGHDGGLTFNPGLRRTEIEKLNMPYSSTETEGSLSKYLKNIGMKGAAIKTPTGYIRHLGWNRHVY
jgi:GT2 family glycosyltransferase